MTGFIYRAVSGDQIAQLIGAEPGEVIAADKTSINLFKVLGAALGLRTGRAVIVSEQENFPTDLYIAQGIATFLGGEHGLRRSSPNFPVKSPYGSPGSVKLLVPPTCFWGGTRFEVPRFS